MFKNKTLNKITSYTLRTVIAILLIAILCCGLISMNAGHLECCNTQNCSLCEMIQMAMNIMSQLFGIIICIYILNIIIPLTYSVYKSNLHIKRFTLVGLQVQHNE